MRGVKKCCTSSALCEADNDMLWNGSEEDVNAGSEWGEDEALIVKMEKVTMVGKGR